MLGGNLRSLLYGDVSVMSRQAISVSVSPHSGAYNTQLKMNDYIRLAIPLGWRRGRGAVVINDW